MFAESSRHEAGQVSRRGRATERLRERLQVPREDPAMQTTLENRATQRYARCIEASKRVRWEIDRDVIRGRRFDLRHKFLPDGLSQVDRLELLSEPERRLLSQIQGRTYANIFGLVERYVSAKVLELGRDHGLGNQVALESLVRFCDEELKHQELFRRIEKLAGDVLAPGYACVADPDDVARVVLSKSTWAVLALTCHIELLTLAHYKESIEPDRDLSELFKDVFLFHWKEESQHAVLDELEWRRVDAALTPAEREEAVDELIELVIAVDGILQAQSAADARYFARVCGRELTGAELESLERGILAAYRWQYILSGARGHFLDVLTELAGDAGTRRVAAALAQLAPSVDSEVRG
jgi:hypothetical protein